MVFVVGHRGCAAIEPENTQRAFRRAVELGCDFVECDVHLTKDKCLVVIHDETVDRTTNGTGRVAELTFEEIRQLDAGQGERIPTLKEVLECIKGKVKLLCELKGPFTAEPALRAVEEAGMLNEVIFTSFELGRIAKVKKLNPKASTGAIFSRPPADFAEQAVAVGAMSCGVHFLNLTSEIVSEAHRHGLIIRGWNPDTEEDMKKTLDCGVDGISSNRPDILLKLLGRLSE